MLRATVIRELFRLIRTSGVNWPFSDDAGGHGEAIREILIGQDQQQVPVHLRTLERFNVLWETNLNISKSLYESSVQHYPFSCCWRIVLFPTSFQTQYPRGMKLLNTIHWHWHRLKFSSLSYFISVCPFVALLKATYDMPKMCILIYIVCHVQIKKHSYLRGGRARGVWRWVTCETQ